MGFVDSPCPAGVSDDYWETLIEDVWTVSREWGQIALDVGWAPLDLFGCNPVPSAGRVDRDGLAVSISRLRTPVQVTGIDPTAATLRCQRGSVMRHYRRQKPGAVYLWHAYGMHGGP